MCFICFSVSFKQKNDLFASISVSVKSMTFSLPFLPVLMTFLHPFLSVLNRRMTFSLLVSVSVKQKSDLFALLFVSVKQENDLFWL